MTRCTYEWNPGTWPYTKRCENDATAGDRCQEHSKPPRLTAHQEEVLMRLYNRWKRTQRAVDAREIGSPVALSHLWDKGYIAVDHLEHGQRGGEYACWIPTGRALVWANRKLQEKGPDV